MVNYISADIIFPISEEPIPQGVIGCDENGMIQAVLTRDEAEKRKIENLTYYNGVLVPGFVNTHCHLELSHLKNKIAEKTGLISFIKEILAHRGQPDEEIIKAMRQADQEMFANGIVAVGDIANQSISKTVKLNSLIYYQTFVEVFGFNAPASETIAKGIVVKEEFYPLKASIVPHAPYSVSSALLDAIRSLTTEDDILSIHNQETDAENQLFESGTGAFAKFFETLGIALSTDHNSKKNALNYHLPKLPQMVNTGLVHNTFSSKTDLDFARQHHQKLYWCLCPNANLYIENTLPDVDLFKREGIKITLGTDSLASNHQLNILAEMKALQDHKQISFDESIRWATLNGAEFLGVESRFGSFDVGKKPGVNLLKLDHGKITNESVLRII